MSGEKPMVYNLKYSTPVSAVSLNPRNTIFAIGTGSGMLLKFKYNIRSNGAIDVNETTEHLKAHRYNLNSKDTLLLPINSLSWAKKDGLEFVLSSSQMSCIKIWKSSSNYAHKSIGSKEMCTSCVVGHPLSGFFAFATGYDWSMGVKGLGSIAKDEDIRIRVGPL